MLGTTGRVLMFLPMLWLLRTEAAKTPRSVSEVATTSGLARSHCRVPLGKPDEYGSNWAQVPQLPTPLLVSQDRRHRDQIEVRALASSQALHLRFDSSVDNLARSREAPNEQVWVDLYPQNDPTERLRFWADFKGERGVSRHRRILGEKSLGAIPDRWQDEPASNLSVLGDFMSPQGWGTYHGLDHMTWWVEIAVPWRDLGLSQRPVTIGLAYGFASTSNSGIANSGTASWPRIATNSITASEPEPGEALIGPDAGAPAGFELTSPRFGKNVGRLVLGQQWPLYPNELRIKTAVPGEEAVHEETVAIVKNQGIVEFNYWLNRSLSSHVDVYSTQRLVLELRESSRNVALYTVSRPMDRHLGVLVDEPYGESGKQQTFSSSTHTRRDAWLDRIVRLLPRLHRQTTAQGAPSDFCLMLPDGKVAANLMADDVWSRLAALVEDRFATVEERLVGAMALVGQKSVTNLLLDPMFFNASGHWYHTALHELMGPLSILRYGGGPAVSRAAVLARLLQHVKDPATGSPFVTRVISLTESGGPKQVTRRYAAYPQLAPFVQQPGRIGAVAVNYRSSQTLLDPTALAFFINLEGRMATLEEMLANESLRRDGAGRLAPIYGKVDPAEVRRQKPDRLLSKGVFPELCPDESGENQPFDLRERQTPRWFIARKDYESSQQEGFLDVFGKPGQRNGAVSVRWTERELMVRVTVDGVSMSSLGKHDRAAERVHLAVDSTHNHLHFYHFSAAIAGERRLWQEYASGIQTLFKHVATEQWIEDREIVNSSWTATLKPLSKGYEVLFRAPWQVLGVDEIPPTIGLNVWVDSRAPHYEQVIFAPPRRQLPVDPFTFADVYLAKSPAAIREIDLDVITWGENMGKAIVVNTSEEPVSIALKAENRLGMRRWLTRSPEVTATVPAGAESIIRFPFFVNPEEKMGTGRNQELRIEGNADGKPFFRGNWSVAYHHPVSAYQRYGSALGKVAKPRPGEEDFLNKKIRYICSRLPQFKMLTTRDGAASDFVLRAEDGSVEFNLMQQGVLDRIGEYVSGLYDNDVDRILGIYFLSYAPSVGRHNSAGHRILNGAGPLSIIRGNFAGGGGNCGYHARLFAGMANHLRIGGKPLVTQPVELWGHAVTALGWRGSQVVMDADVGHFMMKPDGTDLATIEEFRSDPSILSTAGPGEIGRYCTFRDDAVRRPGREQIYEGVFPPGAPVE